MYQDKANQYKAYGEAQVTLPKLKQLVMLYDGAIRSVQQAIEAIRENRIEDRYHSLKKASDIIQGLQGCLDYENGNDIARTLDSYYATIDHQLFTIQRTNSIETCEQIVQALKKMRDAWSEIDMKVSTGQEPTVPTSSAVNQLPSTVYMSA